MRKILSNKLTISIVILAIFILGQILGAAAIKHYFIQSKIEELQPFLSETQEEVSAGAKITKYNDYIIKGYDVYGKEMDIFKEEDVPAISYPDEEMNKVLKSYLSRLISGGSNIAELRAIPNLPSKSIIIGQPIVKDNKVTGGIFLLKPASDYSAALNGFYLVFFITLTIGTVIILIFLKMFIKERNSLEQMRKDYIANISHELKSPIASIKALTETLSDHMIHDQSRIDHYYGIILRESIRLEKLIADLLELSRLQSGKMALKKAVIDPTQLLKKAIEPFSIVAEDMDIRLHVEESIKDIPDVYSNEERLIQVLTILLDNALKFSNGEITVDAVSSSNRIRIMVSDNGPGISKEILPHIFDRFYKEDISHKSVGSGLGLSIAHEIMDLLGEKISVESRVNQGTTFTFTIKRA